MLPETGDIAGTDILRIDRTGMSSRIGIHAIKEREGGGRALDDPVERGHADAGAEFVEQCSHLHGKIRRADHLHDGQLEFMRLPRVLQDPQCERNRVLRSQRDQRAGSGDAIPQRGLEIRECGG